MSSNKQFSCVVNTQVLGQFSREQVDAALEALSRQFSQVEFEDGLGLSSGLVEVSALDDASVEGLELLEEQLSGSARLALSGLV